MGHAIQQQVTLEVEYCCDCGIPFAMPDYLQRRLRQSGDSFYCPKGHGQHYAKSEVDRLREKLAEQTRETTAAYERAGQASKERDAAKRELTRMKRRAKAGVCPCCNRTFQQLARHMNAKHPDYVDEKSTE